MVEEVNVLLTFNSSFSFLKIRSINQFHSKLFEIIHSLNSFWFNFDHDYIIELFQQFQMIWYRNLKNKNEPLNDKEGSILLYVNG